MQVRIERLSTMSPERRNDVLVDLEKAAARQGIEPPAGAWTGPNKETLVAMFEGEVLGSITVQMLPMLEPLIWNEETAGYKAAVIEPLLRRAEGFLQGRGFDECFVLIADDADDVWKAYVTRDGEATTTQGMIVQRDL